MTANLCVRACVGVHRVDVRLPGLFNPLAFVASTSSLAKLLVTHMKIVSFAARSKAVLFVESPGPCPHRKLEVVSGLHMIPRSIFVSPAKLVCVLR